MTARHADSGPAWLPAAVVLAGAGYVVAAVLITATYYGAQLLIARSPADFD
ncbi:hypothetical protein [Salinilacihabitans rarus]|uniref:hypothetical protein n=1 Tax=Salinilacihabitans rarus TaxID=2961596 RepID=UPI0020C86245|nr:hypothetical protein [Salinilacihabitans rarus]